MTALFKLFKRRRQEDPATVRKSGKETLEAKKCQDEGLGREAMKEPTKKTRPEIEVVQKYMDTINNRSTLDKILAFYVSEDAKIFFDDGLTVTARKSAETFQDLYKCFPDVQWVYKNIEIERKSTVVVNDIRAKGTHTGEPFSLLGQADKTVLPNGKKFENDPARFFFEFDTVTMRIASITVVALGIKTGPVGIYEDLTSC